MKLSRLILLLACFAGATLRFGCAARADLWWDTNGATAGSSSGSTAPGTFDGVNWTTNSAGTSATQSWVPGETAVFAAGTNANYYFPASQSPGYGVSVSASSIQVAGLKVEEGYPYLYGPGKTLTFTNGALAVDVAANSRLDINMLYSPTGGVVTKTGGGILYTEATQTTFTGKWVVNGGIVNFPADSTIGKYPAAVVPDQITISNGAGVVGSGGDNRGITLGPGGGGFTYLDTGAPGGPASMGWSGPITGTGPFVVQFHGIAFWGNSTNNYSGDTIIKDGIIDLTAANTIPATSDVKVVGATTTDLQGFDQTINSLSMIAGSYLKLSQGSGRSSPYATLTIQNPAGETIAGIISGGGTLVKNGTGALTVSGNNVSYAFTLNSGTVGIGHDNAFGAGGLLTINGGTLANTATTTRLVPSGVPLTINGDFAADSSLNATPGDLRFLGTTTFNATHTITVGANSSLTLSDLKQSASGAGLIKAGAGTLVVQKVQTTNNTPISGPITVQAGRLRVQGQVILGTGSNDLNLAGGTFDSSYSGNGFNYPLKVLADSSLTTSSTTSVGLTFLSSSVSGTGKLTIRNDSPTAGTVFGVSFNGAGPTFAPGPIEVANGAAGTTVLHSRSGPGVGETFANVISGTGSFDVFGAYFPPSFTGATTLLAENTYTGGTTVTGGYLLVNNTTGSGTGSGPVSVAAAGRLGGTGTIAGAVTNGGTIAPGASIGTLTVNSDVTMSAESHLVVELSGAAADKLVVGGNLNLSSNDFLDVTGAGAGPWVIATYSGLRTGTFDNLTSGYNVDYTIPGQIVLNTIALPGDFSGDGVVDAADYAVWCKTPDAFSGTAGYKAWRANFGKTSSGSGASAVAVPEPAGMVLVAVALLGLLPTGRRRYFISLF